MDHEYRFSVEAMVWLLHRLYEARFGVSLEEDGGFRVYPIVALTPTNEARRVATTESLEVGSPSPTRGMSLTELQDYMSVMADAEEDVPLAAEIWQSADIDGEEAAQAAYETLRDAHERWIEGE